MRFVQLADVHLDSVMGGALRLSSEKREMLRQDIRTALARACALAKEHSADVLLIPGDLFDYESIQPDTPRFLTAAFAEIAPTEVFITPGNHDSLRPGSPYLPRQGADWPENVHIFTSSEFETVVLEELDCTITGIAHAHRGLTDRLLSGAIGGERRRTNLLLVHGSRDGYRPSGKETVIPFSDADLLGQGFTYAALGHYHSFSPMKDELGNVRAAYSGCLQGRGLDETGEKCALVGEIDRESHVTLANVEVAPRRVVSVDVNLTGASGTSAAMDRVDSALSFAGARECDVVCISFVGSAAAGLELDTSSLESSSRHFHVSVNVSRLSADYDLEALAAGSGLRAGFVRKLLDRCATCADPDEERALRDSLHYGLSALDGRTLEPRDAD